MAYKSFLEYLDSKGKTQNTGKVQDVADYNGPTPTKPGKEKKHKDAGGEGQKGQPKPYAGGTNAKDPNWGKLKDGFSGKGDKSLEYKPAKGGKNNASGVPGGKVVSSTWNKTKTQEWVDNTKGLSLAQFTKLIQRKTSQGLNLDECSCQSPLETVKQTVALAKANESVMISLIQELKRNKAFVKFMAEALQHDITYKVLARFIESDERYSRRLVRAMNEMVGPPAHHGDLDSDEDMDSHHERDDDVGHDPNFDSDDDMNGGDDDMDMDHGDDDMDDMDHGGDDDMDSDDGMSSPHDGDPDSDIAPGSKIMPPKKKHGHHHLMNALKDSPLGGGMSGQDAGGLGQSGSGVGGI